MTEAAALRATLDRISAEIVATKAAIRRARHHLSNLRVAYATAARRYEQLGITDTAPGGEGKGALHGHYTGSRTQSR